MSRAKAPTANRLPSGRWSDRDTVILRLLLLGAILFPFFATLVTGGSGGALINTAADAGVYVLLAIGLNVVVGFAGLLDLGYAAFFAPALAEASDATVAEAIARATRQYARRQRIWFQARADVMRLAVDEHDDADAIAARVAALLALS